MDFALDMTIWNINKDEQDKKIHGVGYMDDSGRYEFNNKAYLVWYHMLQLAKDKPDENIICDEWKNYNNFYEWYIKNYYTVGKEKMDLKKNIFDKHNKVFSPQHCIFVPYRIAVLLRENKTNDREYPVGVGKRKGANTYYSSCSIVKNGKKTTKTRNGFATVEEAYNQYKNDRLEYIHNVAEAYMYDIPERLYEALMNWEIDSRCLIKRV